MEVADQWRREWAGTAEYGKVTEGGVTRRVARAMEVLHATAPGARVRVMRAAYHSTAGPGAPASSYMMHSSRRVITSGFNVLETPTKPMKVLEISSFPLESSTQFVGEPENYKVTEPDDLEISEPSKWRGSTGVQSIRMPSEESSSTDNASIIDLDTRGGSKYMLRKHSCDSENSDSPTIRKNNARDSPLLDASLTLNTLKYKSLLNGSSDWNNRRNSYSFEDTPYTHKTILETEDTSGIDSSTDSGICKSSEVVNNYEDNSTKIQPIVDKVSSRDDTIEELPTNKNKDSLNNFAKFQTINSFNRGKHKEENNILLKLSGKVSIKLPITIETDDSPSIKKPSSEDNDRKIKKVEFSKTEVHFAAESGKVNIISTDEKPPPSNDFRKRKNIFVPIFDKPITLFGEKNHEFSEDALSNNVCELGDIDENTAATKSILKNKIPKPKPYLLGENMTLGFKYDFVNKDHSKNNPSDLIAASIINKQEANYEEKYNENVIPTLNEVYEHNIQATRTTNTCPVYEEDSPHEKYFSAIREINKKSMKENYSLYDCMSTKPKTRDLRDSDLTYFGVLPGRYASKKKTKSNNAIEDSDFESTFRSVKLVQQISNSVPNSEVESDESPEYQNIPINVDYVPKANPRLHLKYEGLQHNIVEVQAFQLAPKTDDILTNYDRLTSRRSKLKKREESTSHSIRSISEPPKNKRHITKKNRDRLCEKSTSATNNEHVRENAVLGKSILNNVDKKIHQDESHVYANINILISSVNPITPIKPKSQELERGTTDKNKTKGKRHGISYYNRTPSSDKDIIDNTCNQKEHDVVNCVSKKETKYINQQINDHVQARGSRLSNRIKSTKDTSSLPKTVDERKSRSAYRSYRGKTKSNGEDIGTIQVKETDENNVLQEPIRLLSRDKNKLTEYSKSLRTVNPASDTANVISIKVNKSTQKDSLKNSKHKGYVINYDDKNGTVSSVCKIRSGPDFSKRKNEFREQDNTKNKSFKSKALNKIALRK